MPQIQSVRKSPPLQPGLHQLARPRGLLCLRFLALPHRLTTPLLALPSTPVCEATAELPAGSRGRFTRVRAAFESVEAILSR